MTISVLGPGNIIGEMGLLDGSPRSATCIASPAVQAGGLSRKALERLIEDNPQVGAKLMTGLAKRLAERLRAMSEQIGMYGAADGGHAAGDQQPSSRGWPCVERPAQTRSRGGWPPTAAQKCCNAQ